MNNVLSAVKRWSDLPRLQKGGHVIRLLYAALEIGGGLILVNTGQGSGPASLMIGAWGHNFFCAYSLTMIFSGIGLALIRHMSLWGFFLLTLPFGLFVFFSFTGSLAGLFGWQGTFIFTIFYAVLFTNYWMFRRVS